MKLLRTALCFVLLTVSAHAFAQDKLQEQENKKERTENKKEQTEEDTQKIREKIRQKILEELKKYGITPGQRIRIEPQPPRYLEETTPAVPRTKHKVIQKPKTTRFERGKMADERGRAVPKTSARVEDFERARKVPRLVRIVVREGELLKIPVVRPARIVFPFVLSGVFTAAPLKFEKVPGREKEYFVMWQGNPAKIVWEAYFFSEEGRELMLFVTPEYDTYDIYFIRVLPGGAEVGVGDDVISLRMPEDVTSERYPLDFGEPPPPEGVGIGKFTPEVREKIAKLLVDVASGRYDEQAIPLRGEDVSPYRQLGIFRWMLWSFGEFEVVQYVVFNKSNVPLTLNERLFWQPGVLGVLLESFYLPPGTSTRLWILRMVR